VRVAQGCRNDWSQRTGAVCVMGTNRTTDLELDYRPSGRRYPGRLKQGRVKGFLGIRHFSSLGPLGDSKSIVGTKVYSRLSRIMEAEWMHG
jgi:hypothetical protein